MDVILTNKEIVKLVKMGATAEYSFWTCQNNINSTDPSILADSIKLVGAEHCIMSTDFGQIDNPPAPEGLKLFIAAMLKNGIPEKDIETMVKKNPAKLLKIE
jgi:microsomal dipeptidase-like Zn-dependent dipeptidase